MNVPIQNIDEISEYEIDDDQESEITSQDSYAPDDSGFDDSDESGTNPIGDVDDSEDEEESDDDDDYWTKKFNIEKQKSSEQVDFKGSIDIIETPKKANGYFSNGDNHLSEISYLASDTKSLNLSIFKKNKNSL